MNNQINSAMVLGNLVIAIDMLEQCPEFSGLIPEVRVNLVYALPGAKDRSEVAAVDGRITVVRGTPHASGLPGFGGSDHMARLIIEARKYDPVINAGVNFKCDKTIIEVVKKYSSECGLRFGLIDRKNEPVEVTQTDGSSMPWKVNELVRSGGGMPRLFYESEGWGKEPLFVCLGLDAIEVACIAVDIAKRYKKLIA
jgi:thiamine-phosphate diphosphorylase